MSTPLVPAVLILETDSGDVELTLKFLTALGVRLHHTGGTDQALEQLIQQPEMFRLMLVEIILPYRDGYELAKQIRATPALNHIYIIALTAHRNPVMEEQAFEAGIDEVMTKPYQPKRLRQLILQLGLISKDGMSDTGA